MAALPPGTEGLRLRRPVAPDGQQPAAEKLARVGGSRKEPLIRELVNR